MSKDLKVDGVSYNREWAAGKTEAEFVKEFSGEHMNHIYPDDKDKEAKLKKVYALVKQPAKEEPPVAVAKVTPVSLATNNPGQAAIPAQR